MILSYLWNCIISLLSHIFSLPHQWEPLICVSFPVDVEKIEPFLYDDLEVDIYQEKAWVSLIPSKTTYMYSLFGIKFGKVVCNEVQMITYVKLENIKGYLPLILYFDDWKTSFISNYFQRYPFGSECKEMVANCTVDQFQFEMKGKDVTFEIEATKSNLLPNKELVEFLFTNRWSIFGVSKGDGIYRNRLSGGSITQPHIANINRFYSNCLKHFGLGEMESIFNIKNMEDGQLCWLDGKNGDLLLEEKMS